MTNVRGRYDFSVAVLDLEVDRLINTRDFAQNYGKLEWLAESNSVNHVQVCEDEYKKLIVCFDDNTQEDITEQVQRHSTNITCPSNDKNLTVSITCGTVNIRSEKSIVAVRGLAKLPESEIKKNFIKENSSILTAFLRWQLLADIDANSSGVAYNTYARLLISLEKLEVI